MPRRDLELCAGEWYHLYNRRGNRERIFYERANYLFFLQRLRRYLVPVLDVVAYCLMPTHYHLLVRVTKTSEVSETSEVSAVSRAMQRFSISYTKAMNRRYDRAGSLFQGAFRAKHVSRNDYLVHLSRYIHLNPVIAGLVERPEDWEFSSHREYIGLRSGTLPKAELILSQFSSQQSYQEFVEAYAPGEREIIADLLFD
ncbi:MAG: transposase [Anaerolineae bacterium]|jgi:REP element-mobilizing transposase RayT